MPMKTVRMETMNDFVFLQDKKQYPQLDNYYQLDEDGLKKARKSKISWAHFSDETHKRALLSTLCWHGLFKI